jgi:alpha-1,2-mannosyltransferase
MRLKTSLWPAVLVLAAVVAYTVRVRHEMVDFAVYRTAGARALEAAPLFRAEDGHYQFKYFPAFALAMAPFALLPEEAAKAVWFGLSVALLAVLVRLSVRTIPEPRLPSGRLAWITVLLMAKFYAHELNLGQTNILLGVLLVAALAAALRGRNAWAGALVGAGVFVKPYALILAPWLVFAAGAAGLTTFAAVVGGGLFAPAVVYGWSGNIAQVVAWYRTVTDTTAPNLLAPENVSIATMWAKWLGSGPTASLLAVMTMAITLLVAAATWVWRRDVRQPIYLEFGLLMLLVPLLSPQGWDYVFLLATPAAVCLADRFQETSRSHRLITAAGFGLLSFTIYDILGRPLYVRLMALSVVSVAALALVVSLVLVRRQKLA